MPRAMRVCSRPGCPNITTGGRCTECKAKAEQQRGGHQLRGGGNSAPWRHRRRQCLIRDPLCVCTDAQHGHGAECLRPSTVADHYPVSKRDLVAAGVRDPDALEHLRGLCASCHNKHTAATSPAGFRNQ